jgi:hypothetical protein
MGVKLQSALGGSVELNAPSTASNFTMTVPAGNGTVATTDQLQNFRNRIINGACNIAQRATSATNTGENYATVDRMRMRISSTGGTINQSQGTGPSAALPNSIRFTQATATANTTSAWYSLRYNIEKADSMVFASSNSATLSFWYRSSKTGSHAWAVDFTNAFSGTGAAQSGTFTVTAANTWEYKTITINYSASANSFGVLLSVGPSTEGQTTITSMAVNDYFEFSGLQFEAGSVATPFEHRPYNVELHLCKRYYEVVQWLVNGYSAQWTGVEFYGGFYPFEVEKRTTPSIANFTNSGYWVAAGQQAFSSQTTHNFTISYVNTKAFNVRSNRPVGNSNPTVGGMYMWENNPSIPVSAEL